ncbi:hypothetical protein CSKR_107371 [Clonorchis sinensis]|uniref:Uncharacterized protein n=2 Tax=Clonorchis sinensis TaxID=79923 RepID=G7YTL9_CLOSI|nr:hypothetical protein CSKR_107371 [Clonorchis sinensis]GAA56299.1 hypothetical protein CLF_110531 [Clonorchis sinensis]
MNSELISPLFRYQVKKSVAVAWLPVCDQIVVVLFTELRNLLMNVSSLKLTEKMPETQGYFARIRCSIVRYQLTNRLL